MTFRYRYFVTEPGQPEREVTEEEWCRQERRAGFHLGHGPDDPSKPATSGFSDSRSGLSGRMEMIP